MTQQAMIDLRSDTLTKPSAEMRQAMAGADVNDDVIDTDPTVAKLQTKIAEMLGKSAALFMPSGTMTNQTAVRLHCKPGDELICEEGCHIYNYEQGAYASLSGIAVRAIRGDNYELSLSHVAEMIRPDDEHTPRTTLVCLENTHNKGGGKILNFDDVVEICSWAHENGLKTHLDGARLFNAVIGSGISAERWAEHFDTISVCFSKGLGAPVGSALVGDQSMIAELRRHRKLFGGGMRQSGIIAAGALYALENSVQRLTEDHENAKLIAQTVSDVDGLSVNESDVHTNIVIFQVDPGLCSAPEFCEKLLAAGVWTFPFSNTSVRAVTHLHIDANQARRAGEIIAETANATMNVSS